MIQSKKLSIISMIDTIVSQCRMLEMSWLQRMFLSIADQELRQHVDDDVR